MRLRISAIFCFTLFALSHAAPSRKPEGESAKKDDQSAPLLEQGQDPFTYYGPQEPGDAMMNDCCAPSPTCANPCPPQAPPQSFAINFAQPPPPMPPPPPPPVYTGDSCCPPGPACANPCAPPMAPPMPPPPPMPMAPPCGPPPMSPCAPMMPPPPMPMPPPPMPMAPPCGAPPMNPCAPMMAPPMMPPPMMGGPCCDPNVVQQCSNPCAPAQPPAGDEGQQQTYAPYPGEITFKLMQKWKDEYLDENSAGTQILKGNVETAIKAALEGDQPQNDYMGGYGGYGYGGYGGYGQQQAPRQVTVSNIYFREGYVPGNPSTLPITVAHVMVNGGSDDASKLQALVTPDGSLGDGLKVYKDSFSAY